MFAATLTDGTCRAHIGIFHNKSKQNPAARSVSSVRWRGTRAKLATRVSVEHQLVFQIYFDGCVERHSAIYKKTFHHLFKVKAYLNVLLSPQFLFIFFLLPADFFLVVESLLCQGRLSVAFC